jgi:hypothetical protein
VWGHLGPGQREGRHHSRPTGDGDDSAEGWPARAQATALGAEAAVGGDVERKTESSRSELCGLGGREK